MNEKPSRITQTDLERELTNMTAPSNEKPELWCGALEQSRRKTKRGTRAIPGRRRLIGLGALASAVLVLALGALTWIGLTPEPVVTTDAVVSAPPPVSSGMDITRSLDQMLPHSFATRAQQLQRNVIRDLGGNELRGRVAQVDAAARLGSFDRADQERDARISAEPSPLREPGEVGRRESLLQDAAPKLLAMETADAGASAASTPMQTTPSWRLLERRADVGIRVPHVATTAAAVKAIADTEAGEFVGETSVQGEGHRAKAAVVLRVASARHDAVIESISALGAVVSFESQTEDLSLAADDLDAQMMSAEKTDRDYADLYYNYATPNATEAAKLIQSAAVSRSTVNQLMARRAELVDRAAWSTIRVLIIAERPPRVPSPARASAPRSESYLSNLRDEVAEAAHDAGQGALVVLRAAIISLPIGAVLIPLGVFIWWRLRRRSIGK